LYNPRDVSPGALVWTVSTATRLPLISVPLFLALGVAGAESALSGILWAALCLLLTAGLSTLYLEYLRRNVRLGDPTRLAQGWRLRPLRVVAAQCLVAWALVSLLGVPFGLGSLVLLYALLATLLSLLAPEEEISLHAAGVCVGAVALTHAFGPLGLLVFLLLPPVWWARTATSRHTHRELELGALAGAFGGLVVFLLTGG
jgi:hypothetical protein